MFLPFITADVHIPPRASPPLSEFLTALLFFPVALISQSDPADVTVGVFAPSALLPPFIRFADRISRLETHLAARAVRDV
ncbi:hypothetical protein AGQ47_24555 [Salmonella enterica subsp. enterica]|nr:hypothetical protein AGQ47_24555 [Salmonella enterica subsp. enterica]